MVRRSGGLLVLLSVMVLLSTSSGLGQTPGASAPTPADDLATDPAAIQVTALRDSFVKQSVAAGFTCPFAPPKIVLQDVPSWGNYEDETNILITPLWQQISDEEKAVFTRLAGPKATPETAKAEFETGAHHWIFIHEMGHWLQACNHQVADKNHYASEFGADRIATAYWREQDPALLDHMAGLFRRIVKRSPNPVPAGQVKEKYFNENYEKLGPTPAYIWFQSDMCVTTYEEKPAPTFAEALRQIGK